MTKKDKNIKKECGCREEEKKDEVLEADKDKLIKEYLEGWQRCKAEMENYKKRQAETQKDFAKFACQNIVMEILPVLDNFHASTGHVPEEQRDTPWVTGIMHIQKQLEKTLENYGVTEIETKAGDYFNPEIHEAVEDKDKKETKEIKNKVAKIIQKGYKMDSKIIRPARVIVE